MVAVNYSVSEKWNGDRVTRAVGIGAQRGVNLALERLRALSVPLAPLDMGPLRASATIVEATPNRAEGSLVFDTPYAVIQHERLDFAHTDGQAKYVEEPLHRYAGELQALIAREVRGGIVNA